MGTLCSCQFPMIIPKWNEVAFWPPAAKEGIQRIRTNHHHGQSHSARPARSGQNGKVAGKNCPGFMVFYVEFLRFSQMVSFFGLWLGSSEDLSIVYGPIYVSIHRSKSSHFLHALKSSLSNKATGHRPPGQLIPRSPYPTLIVSQN